MSVLAPPPIARAPHVISPGLTATEGALDLLPIPAALVSLDAAGRLIFEVVNRHFGAGALSREPSLVEHVVSFLRSDQMSVERGWHTGEATERRFYRVSCVRVRHRAEPVCLVSLVDQTSEVRTLDTLRHEMTTDSLTGLPNRAAFGDAVEVINADGARRWAVLMVDLERFSRFNTCLGAMAGDELLITVARRIKGALRSRDLLARTGGDEFGILLAIDSTDDEGAQVAARLRQALSTPFRLSGFEVRISCAVGIALGDGGATASEDVIRRAQVAMKRSKTSGLVETYEQRTLDTARAELTMETALRRAIDQGELSLAFQPICALDTGAVIAFEALARWIGQDGVARDPASFIPVAEQSGLIVPLGRWAIDAATRTLAAWDARAGGDCGVAIAVNVSPIQLGRDHVPNVVERALAANGLGGRRLKIELTESAIVTDPARSAEVLDALKALGVSIAMDDFGTGFSNLAALQQLPIDLLKIDRSFVTGMLADRDKIAIVRAILGLAQALGMATVAEGIETREAAHMLGALGCAFGQGYVFSRPLDADEAYSFLSRSA